VAVERHTGVLDHTSGDGRERWTFRMNRVHDESSQLVIVEDQQ